MNCLSKLLHIEAASEAKRKRGRVTSLYQRYLGCLTLLLMSALTAGAVNAQVPLIEDGVVAGQIDFVGDQDEFSFSVSAGEAVHIRVVEVGGNTAFNPYVTLFNPDNTVEDVDGGGATDAALDCYSASFSCQLNQSGTYKIRVQDDGDDYTGTYEVHYVRISTTSENGLLNADGYDTSTITLGDIDTYSFNAVAGQSVLIRIAEVGGNTSFNPYVWLYNPDNTLEDVDGGGSQEAAITCHSSDFNCQLNQTGTYRILIQDDGNDYAGSYEIRLSLIPQSNELGILRNHKAVSESITLADIDTYTFEATAGDAAHIHIAETGGNTSFNPYVWLFYPDGTLADVDGGGSTDAVLSCNSSDFTCQLNQTGTYSVVVQDDGNDYPGSYDIHLSHIPFGSENGNLENDGSISGEIDPGDIDTYTFHANPGDAVHIRVAETGGNTSFNPYVWLYNPDGSLEDVDGGGSQDAALNCHSYDFTCQLNQSGTYRLLVQDDGNDYSGSYDIHFSHIPFANENGFLTNGVSVNSSITIADIDTFAFYAAAGSSVSIDVAETGLGTSFSPFAWLYAPNGILLDTDSDSSLAEIDCSPGSFTCNLNQTGIYRLVVQDDGNDYPGNYQVTFSGPAQPPLPIGSHTWPMSPTASIPVVTQDHSCRGSTNLFPGAVDDSCVSSSNHHAGLDLVPTTSDDSVVASAGGVIVPGVSVAGCTNGDTGCNSGFGNTVVIEHGNGVFSQYSHLKPGSVSKTSGFVAQGEKIGEVGETGNVTGPHLHWELKNHGGLFDVTGIYAAYTPTYPGNYGYFDPWEVVASTTLAPVVVEVDVTPLPVWRGPGTQYSIYTALSDGQQFVAFASAVVAGNTWYRIHLPCDGSETCAGWIQGNYTGGEYAIKKPFADSVEVVDTGTTGVNVRGAVGGPTIDKVFDGQGFSVIGESPADGTCGGDWYRVSTPESLSGSPSGWVCGDYLHYYEPPGCF